MSKVRRSGAVLRLLGALYRFQAEWRGHPANYASLHGLLVSPDRPWQWPSLVYRVPLIPVRIWLRAGDALLFRLWAWSRVPLARLTAAADPTFVERTLAAHDAAVRKRVNDDLALRDSLGLAPDGGSFSATAETYEGEPVGV